MSENPKHYRSDTPCSKCGGHERYKSTKNCVPCAKAAVVARRARLASQAIPPADNYEDLL